MAARDVTKRALAKRIAFLMTRNLRFWIFSGEA
jgi:hypothetical protein